VVLIMTGTSKKGARRVSFSQWRDIAEGGHAVHESGLGQCTLNYLTELPSGSMGHISEAKKGDDKYNELLKGLMPDVTPPPIRKFGVICKDHERVMTSFERGRNGF
jgi:hypothetical protein